MIWVVFLTRSHNIVTSLPSSLAPGAISMAVLRLTAFLLKLPARESGAWERALLLGPRHSSQSCSRRQALQCLFAHSLDADAPVRRFAGRRRCRSPPRHILHYFRWKYRPKSHRRCLRHAQDRAALPRHHPPRRWGLVVKAYSAIRI